MEAPTPQVPQQPSQPAPVPAAAPPKAPKPPKQPSSYRVSWPVVFAITLIVFAALGAWQYVRTSKANSQLSAKEEQIQTKQKEIAQLTAERDKALNSLTSSAGVADYVGISEWGVKFKPGADLQDLSYFINKDSLLSSTKSLLQTAYTSSLAHASEADGSAKYTRCEAGSFGILTRGKAGKAIMSTTIEKVPGAVKVGDYYYIIEGPQASCSADKVTADLQTKQAAAFKEVIKTLVRSGE